MERHVFYISDRTGISAEILGRALLSQFVEQVKFIEKTIPFIDTVKKAEQFRQLIDETAEKSSLKPIIFDTVVSPDIRAIIRQSSGVVMDFFQTFIGPLEKELNTKSSFSVGRQHSIDRVGLYDGRITAVNFALNSDDGASMKYYDEAETILLGVSRCGKTPTSLYAAMQFGIKAANYPFVAEDMQNLQLPPELKKNKKKLYGLTINPPRLHEIRTERRPNSQYASLEQCRLEIRLVESLYRKEKIPFLNTTSKSIEEITTLVLTACNLERRSF
ncbi:MAG: phosphoenolpyruvate synthase regulatory protein [Gammaproteobacteria bacterium CG22_combo_CG10-13_8_21_14_all_40_8]|nr:MAG: phosphoenolpyruvate synthase regulatory protein [Gammaproteobacteria bacterium CG22_combo_CG10-13_8_21_14_all_40_8]